MHYHHAFILGLIQGVTEFLPISSSAHLLLVPWFFDWLVPGLAFDAFLHLGTLLAVALYFHRDLWRIGMAGLKSIIERKIGYDRDRSFFWLLIVGSIPAGLAGMFLGSWIEDSFRAPLLVAINLALVGFLLYWIDGKCAAVKNLDEIGGAQAVWIGLAQAFALVPGVSRSGSTMGMARLLGYNREAAARFSFLLGFPIILAAALYKVHDLARAVQGSSQLDSTYLITGLCSSAFFGIVSIHFLLRWLRSTSFAVFAWYRILLAAVVILWSVVRS